MSFNKATKLFSFLTTSGVAIGVTIGMIIFNGNKELLKKEEEQALDNFDLELKKFENEELLEQEQSDDPKDKEGDSGADDKKEDEGKSLEEDKGKEDAQEKGAGEPKETVIEVPDNQETSVSLGPDLDNKDLNSLLTPNFAGKEEIKMDYGEEKKVILGDGGTPTAPAPEKPDSAHFKGEHVSGEECEDCPKGEKSKPIVEAESEEMQTPPEQASPSVGNEEEEASDLEDSELQKLDTEAPSLTPESEDIEDGETAEDLRQSSEALEAGTQKSELEEQSGPEGFPAKDSPKMQDGQEEGESEDMAGEQETEDRGRGNDGPSEESTDDGGSAIADKLQTLMGLYGDLGKAILNLRPKVS